jgi:hypothetical protein
LIQYRLGKVTLLQGFKHCYPGVPCGLKNVDTFYAPRRNEEYIDMSVMKTVIRDE